MEHEDLFESPGVNSLERSIVISGPLHLSNINRYPQEMAGHTRIHGHNYHFARDSEEGNIMPHDPSLLALVQACHCLEVIHSEQCNGYVLKYCAKNSDAGRISVQNVLYEGYSVTRVHKLQCYAATRISSA
jgi:hypothetical protein